VSRAKENTFASKSYLNVVLDRKQVQVESKQERERLTKDALELFSEEKEVAAMQTIS
jgi:hypothetical protein